MSQTLKELIPGPQQTMATLLPASASAPEIYIPSLKGVDVQAINDRDNAQGHGQIIELGLFLLLIILAIVGFKLALTFLRWAWRSFSLDKTINTVGKTVTRVETAYKDGRDS